MSNKIVELEFYSKMKDLFDDQEITLTKEVGKTSQNYENKNRIFNEFQSKSFKRKKSPHKNGSFEINLLDQHFLAIKNIARMFFSIFVSIPEEQISQKTSTSENSEEFFETKIWKFIDENLTISIEKRKQFLTDLQYEVNLRKFLQFLGNNFPEEIMLELTGISFRIWEKYIELTENTKLLPHEPQFLQKLKNEMIELFEGSTKYLFLEIDFLLTHNQAELTLPHFISVFTETVYLVIEDFFCNPYSLDQQIISVKRPKPIVCQQGQESWENLSWRSCKKPNNQN